MKSEIEIAKENINPFGMSCCQMMHKETCKRIAKRLIEYKEKIVNIDTSDEAIELLDNLIKELKEVEKIG